MTDERILKKVGKLLELYGVSPEEKDKFLTDLQDKKYDEEEENAEVPNEEQVDETEKEEVEVKENENENQEEVVESEESVEEETKPEGEEVETETEEQVEEQPLEEQPEEEQAYDYHAEIEELRKSNEGLSARLQTLEDIVAKLGVEEMDQTMGASPNGNPVDEQYNSAFDEINRKRVG